MKTFDIIKFLSWLAIFMLIVSGPLSVIAAGIPPLPPHPGPGPTPGPIPVPTPGPTPPPCPGSFICIVNPLTAANFWQLVRAVTNLIILVGVLLAPLMFAWGALQFTMSAGDPQKTRSAQNTMKFSLLGLVLLVAGWAIVGFIIDVIGSL